MNPLLYFLESLDFLDWWLLAIALGIADIFVPRARLVSGAIAAGGVGFVLMLFPQIAWPWQLGGFVILTAAGVIIPVTGIHPRGRRSPRYPLCRRRMMSNFHDFNVKTIEGKDQSLKAYQDKVALVVNVASECGLTPQYAGLEQLYREFSDRGFVVVGLPCNQFGRQEPGTEAQIKAFCSTHYAVTFPLTGKIEVNGKGAHPLYVWLKNESGGADIQWNFEKFLIGKDGRLIRRYAPKTVPEDKQLRADLRAAL